MNAIIFKKLWGKTGLFEYCERMEGLKSLGFSFDINKQLDQHEAEAINIWLGEEKTISDVTLEELGAAKFFILVIAKTLREIDKNKIN